MQIPISKELMDVFHSMRAPGLFGIEALRQFHNGDKYVNSVLFDFL